MAKGWRKDRRRHQEAATMGRASGKGRNGQVLVSRSNNSKTEKFAIDVQKKGQKALSVTPVVGGAVKAIPEETLVESAKSSPIGSLGRKDLSKGEKAKRFALATATSGLSNLYYAKKDKKPKED